MADRIESIQAMLRKDPRDTFLRYSLGMEYMTAGRHAEAAEQFEKCIDLDDQYLAAYVEAGKALRSAGRLDRAKELFAAGMELAAMQGEAHMRDHIQQQLDSLPAD